jgi:hypothetical protein
MGAEVSSRLPSVPIAERSSRHLYRTDTCDREVLVPSAFPDRILAIIVEICGLEAGMFET